MRSLPLSSLWPSTSGLFGRPLVQDCPVDPEAGELLPVVTIVTDNGGPFRSARSRGGRPPGFDPTAHCQRSVVERSFNRLKNWRGIATRTDKAARNYRAGIVLAATLIWILEPLVRMAKCFNTDLINTAE